MEKHLKTPAVTGGTDPRLAGVRDTVTAVDHDVRRHGDEAVRRYSEQFDGWSPESFKLSEVEIKEIVASLPDQVIQDIVAVQDRVRKFAQHQRDSLQDFEVETEPGVFLGQKNIPVSAVGAYVPVALSARGIRSHDGRDSQGCRGATGDGVYAADPG